jgi:hypothetical protein
MIAWSPGSVKHKSLLDRFVVGLALEHEVQAFIIELLPSIARSPTVAKMLLKRW